MGQMAEGMPIQLSYSQFYGMAEENKTSPTLRTAVQTEDHISGERMDGSRYRVDIPPNDPDLIRVLRENVKDFRVEPPRTFLLSFLFNLAAPLAFLAFFWFLVYRGAQGGGRILAFGKSRARQISDMDNRFTFEDVAGVDEAKEELKEVIEFLKDPKRFQRLGGKIPKGVLLMGPPGTGKTLLAKAVAGEAGVPFFSISGSDFVEMFVGVGASRVRDLFEQAKKSAKVSGRGCIIFIDE
ncbi:MAG: AAA family ATPase, partial [Candidatus Omnitrophica bacterium]|nr:AAA family ATPase [Candidatus Omnitrophota bacterium]